MRRWRVLVADDEPSARRGVRQLLAAFPDFGVVAEARDGVEVLQAVASAKPHVVFLDIEMPELGGLEVTRRLPTEGKPLIVFLTAYDEFAVRAFDVEAADYLVKPVSEARFAATMRRVARRLAGDTPAPTPTLSVSTPRGTVIIPVHQIDWVEAADYYSLVWVAGRSYLLRESLTRLERRVGKHGFARAHRHALVRVGGVRAIRATPAGEALAILESGARVPVSRRRRRAFTEAVRRASR